MADTPGGQNVEIRGLREFRAALRAMGPEWAGALKEAHKAIGDLGANAARQVAAGMGGIQAKAKSAIGGKATAANAAVGVFPSSVDRMGNVAFWGAKRHTGWYANPRYSSSSGQQHPDWVGASWEPAVAGQGPYAINQALAEHLDDILDEYGNAIDQVTLRAFPDRLSI